MANIENSNTTDSNYFLEQNRQLASALVEEKNRCARILSERDKLYNDLNKNNFELAINRNAFENVLKNAKSMLELVSNICNEIVPLLPAEAVNNETFGTNGTINMLSNQIVGGSGLRNSTSQTENNVADSTNDLIEAPENSHEQRLTTTNSYRLYTVHEENDENNTGEQTASCSTQQHETIETPYSSLPKKTSLLRSIHSNGKLIPKRLPLTENNSFVESFPSSSFSTPPNLTENTLKVQVRRNIKRRNTKSDNPDVVNTKSRRLLKRQTPAQYEDENEEQDSLLTAPKNINGVSPKVLNDSKLQETTETGSFDQELTFKAFQPQLMINQTSTPLIAQPSQECSNFVTKRRNGDGLTSKTIETSDNITVKRCSVIVNRLNIVASEDKLIPVLTPPKTNTTDELETQPRRPVRTTRPSKSLKEPSTRTKLRRT